MSVVKTYFVRPEDGFDEIHWKATAKRRHPITKVFQVERTQEVYAVIDASRLSARSTAVKQGSVSDAPCDLNAGDSLTSNSSSLYVLLFHEHSPPESYLD